MINSRHSKKKIVYIIIAGIVLGIIFTLKALQNYTHQDYVNTNFFFFWLSGRMVWTGQNPYDQISWLAGHDAFGATWKPNIIFPYPLPLMFFMAPLGLLSLGRAYVSWQIVTQIIIALCVFILLRHWPDPSRYLLYLPIIIILLFFGPVYLTLQIGSIGALALAAILFAIVSMEKDHSLLGGMILSLTFLGLEPALDRGAQVCDLRFHHFAITLEVGIVNANARLNSFHADPYRQPPAGHAGIEAVPRVL